MKIFINYKQNISPDHDLARHVEIDLRRRGNEVFRDESGIKAGQQWNKRIHDEIERCEVMVSLLSNSGLQSDFVLAEIDRAKKLGKRLIPVRLGNLDSERELLFRGLFMTVQYYDATGENDHDAQTIADAISGGKTRVYEDLVLSALSESGITNPLSVILVLLWLLRGYYVSAIGAGSSFFDGLDSLTGRHAINLADSLRNLAFVEADRHQHNAGVRMKIWQEANARELESAAQHLRCIARILSLAIETWDKEGAELKITLAQFHKEIQSGALKSGGTPSGSSRP